MDKCSGCDFQSPGSSAPCFSSRRALRPGPRTGRAGVARTGTGFPPKASGRPAGSTASPGFSGRPPWAKAFLRSRSRAGTPTPWGMPTGRTRSGAWRRRRQEVWLFQRLGGLRAVRRATVPAAGLEERRLPTHFSSSYSWAATSTASTGSASPARRWWPGSAAPRGPGRVAARAQARAMAARIESYLMASLSAREGSTMGTRAPTTTPAMRASLKKATAL